MTNIVEPFGFESELRSALLRHADELPSETVLRLRAIKYRPRRLSRTTLFLLGSVVAVGAALGATIASSFGPVGNEAFAAWSPAPTTPVPGQVGAADTRCLKAVNAFSAQWAQSSTTVSLPSGAALEGAAYRNWKVVADDTRGPYTLVVLAFSSSQFGDAENGCLTGPGELSKNPVLDDLEDPPGEWGFPGTIPEGHIGPLSMEPGANGAVTVSVGVVGPGVRNLLVELGDGTVVTATVGNEFWAAWWPGSAVASAVQAASALGTVSRCFEASPPSPGTGNTGDVGSSGTLGEACAGHPSGT